MRWTVFHPSRRRLLRFGDRECPEVERARVAAHLASCTACRASVAFQRELRHAARSVEAPPPPAGLLPRILAERAAGERILLPADAPATSAPRRLRAAGVAVLLLALGGALLLSLRERGRTASFATGAARVTGEDSLPARGGVLSVLGLTPTAAYGQVVDPDGPRGTRPNVVRDFPSIVALDGSRLRPGRWSYELRVRRGGEPAAVRGRIAIELARVTYQGSPAWQLSDGWQDHPGELAETTLMDARTLAPLQRIATDVGRGRFRIVQWFAPGRLQGTIARPGGAARAYERELPAEGTPYFAGEDVIVAVLRAAPLRPGWRGRLSLLGWGAVRSDLAYPVGIAVVGEERIVTPVGAFDCWRLGVVGGRSASGHEVAAWVRKSDGVPVLARLAEPGGTIQERVLVDESPPDAQGGRSEGAPHARRARRHGEERPAGGRRVAAETAAPRAKQGRAPQIFRVDAGHSEVAFSIGFLHGHVRGEFDQLRGTLLYDAARPESSSVSVVIDVHSLHTGSAHRDEHLRGEDFFDAERYPTIAFQSRRVTRAADGLLVVGALSLHGVTREVSLPVRVTQPPVADPHGTSLVHFAGALRLARKDFGVLGGSAHNPWFDELRSATMADSVDVTLEVEGWEPDCAPGRSAEAEARLKRFAEIGGTEGLAARARKLAAESPDTLKAQGWEWAIDQLGCALLARGRTVEGLAALRLNTELFPRSPAAHTALGSALAAAGDAHEAARSYERALALDPGETRAIELLRRLHR